MGRNNPRRRRECELGHFVSTVSSRVVDHTESLIAVTRDSSGDTTLPAIFHGLADRLVLIRTAKIGRHELFGVGGAVGCCL